MTDFFSDFSAALDRLFPEEERPELHFSSIGNCGAQQLYRIRGVPRTDPPEGFRRWAPEMGKLAQMLATQVALEMGCVITDVGASVSWHGVIGQTDGSVVPTGPLWAQYESPLLFEVKARSVFGYLEMVRGVTEGPAALLEKDPATALQIQGYLAATNLPACWLWIIAFDQAGLRGHIRFQNSRRAKADQPPIDVNPVITQAIIPAVPEQQDLLAKRAEMLTLAITTGQKVMREYNPSRDRFPCPYCSWHSLCIAEGGVGDITLPDWR